MACTLMICVSMYCAFADEQPGCVMCYLALPELLLTNGKIFSSRLGYGLRGTGTRLGSWGQGLSAGCDTLCMLRLLSTRAVAAGFVTREMAQKAMCAQP